MGLIFGDTVSSLMPMAHRLTHPLTATPLSGTPSFSCVDLLAASSHSKREKSAVQQTVSALSTPCTASMPEMNHPRLAVCGWGEVESEWAPSCELNANVSHGKASQMSSFSSESCSAIQFRFPSVPSVRGVGSSNSLAKNNCHSLRLPQASRNRSGARCNLSLRKEAGRPQIQIVLPASPFDDMLSPTSEMETSVNLISNDEYQRIFSSGGSHLAACGGGAVPLLRQKFPSFNATEILPGLFLSGHHCAADLEALKAYNISLVINVAEECCVKEELRKNDCGVRFIQLFLRDHSDECIAPALLPLSKIIHLQLHRRKRFREDQERGGALNQGSKGRGSSRSILEEDRTAVSQQQTEADRDRLRDGLGGSTDHSQNIFSPEECNGGVIVHCRMGVSRSATIILSYLMLYGSYLESSSMPEGENTDLLRFLWSEKCFRREMEEVSCINGSTYGGIYNKLRNTTDACHSGTKDELFFSCRRSTNELGFNNLEPQGKNDQLHDQSHTNPTAFHPSMLDASDSSLFPSALLRSWSLCPICNPSSNSVDECAGNRCDNDFGFQTSPFKDASADRVEEKWELESKEKDRSSDLLVTGPSSFGVSVSFKRPLLEGSTISMDRRSASEGRASALPEHETSRRGWRMKRALKYVHSLKPDINPNIGFVMTLKSLASQLGDQQG